MVEIKTVSQLTSINIQKNALTFLPLETRDNLYHLTRKTLHAIIKLRDEL